MKDKEIKKRFIGSVELINNLSEDAMVETYNLDPENLTTEITSEFIGDISLQLPTEGPTRTKPSINVANLGNAFVLEVTPLKKEIRMRTKELLIGLYKSGYLPCNYDWHHENLAGLPDTHQGMIVVTKSRNIGLVVTTDKLKEDNLPEDIAGLRYIVAKKRILAAIHCIKNDNDLYDITINEDVIFEPRMCRITPKDREHRSDTIITLYVYEFKYKNKSVKNEGTVIQFKPREVKN